MRYLIQFQVNIFSLFILFGLYLFFRTTKVKSYSKWLIHLLIIATAVGIVMEPLTWIFDREHFFLAYYLEYISNFILFLVAPIIAGLLMTYVDFRLYKNPKRISSKWYYQHGSIFTLIVLLINIGEPLYFSVDPVTHGFSQGDWVYMHYILILSLYLFMLVLVFNNRKKLLLKEAVIFVLCFFIPIIGMVIQMYASKVHLSWTSIVFSLFIVYIFLETSPTEVDFLTHVYNRKSYETYITYLVQNSLEFCVISFDLNKFKEINDQYGHSKGDAVLITFAEILKRTFSEVGIVARLGGDEFAVVLTKNWDAIEDMLDQVIEAIHQHKDPVLQSLEFSYGHQIYSSKMSIDEFYISVDEKMYAMKKNEKPHR